MKKETTIKTNWDLGLLYKSEKDLAIEVDLKKAEAAYAAFAKKYADREDYLKDEALLAAALLDYEKLHDVDIAKPYIYFKYRQDLNAKDGVAEAQVNLLSQRCSKVANTVIFFPLALGKIPKADQQRYLSSKHLAPYRYFLQCIFDQSAHLLSEPEEKVINLLGLPAYSLWVDGNEKLVSSQKLPWKNKQVAVTEAISMIANLPAKERQTLGGLVNAQLKSISAFAESELNAVVTTKKIEDELRRYAKPYSATVLGYQNELATVENLVAVVSTHFPLAHRFYKLKAKMLGLKTLSYSDRNAPVGKAKKKIEFKEAVEIVQTSFEKFGPEYKTTFQEFLQSGQIDVFPKAGKRGGAYCSSYGNLPTFVMLNHLPDFNSVMTMAHEMGHAFHAKYSHENQRPLYRDHSICAAEVASTFFENFAFDEVFSKLSEKEKLVALHDKIAGSVNTIFRQIACFNFELELHETIRQKGSLSKEDMAKLMNKHMQSYLGPVFRLTDDDGYFFVYWSHLRRFFYVYSYAFGELVSSALYEMYKKNPAAKTQIYQFLCAGGSDSPENIFKQAGIDVTKPEFFEEGLKKIEEDIDRLEKLLKKN